MRRRSLVLAYGIASYFTGVAGLAAIILFMAGFYPLTGKFVFAGHPLAAIVFNILLTLLFGLQHSVMARQGFKKVFNGIFGPESERSTFVAASGIVSLIVVTLWQPVPGMVWQAQGAVSTGLLWLGFAFGWGYLLAATFAINHWDLFGLRQVWLAFRNQPYTPPRFKEGWMYRYSRHPIMVGVLVGMWFVPVMDASRFTMTLTFSAYVFIGVAFEERDLVRQFGQQYLDYKKRVGMLFTLKRN